MAGGWVGQENENVTQEEVGGGEVEMGGGVISQRDQ